MSRSFLSNVYKFNSYRPCLNKYVTSLNNKPNGKSPEGPGELDKRIKAATSLMKEPINSIHPKAKLTEDFRIEHVIN